jgi:hypothetical protein
VVDIIPVVDSDEEPADGEPLQRVEEAEVPSPMAARSPAEL